MQTLKSWLEEERGRAAALAKHLDVTAGRVSQIADTGVPDKYKLAVRDFTGGAVTLEAMVAQRTPGQEVFSELESRATHQEGGHA